MGMHWRNRFKPKQPKALTARDILRGIIWPDADEALLETHKPYILSARENLIEHELDYLLERSRSWVHPIRKWRMDNGTGDISAQNRFFDVYRKAGIPKKQWETRYVDNQRAVVKQIELLSEQLSLANSNPPHL